jgi:hypothetical protein
MTVFTKTQLDPCVINLMTNTQSTAQNSTATSLIAKNLIAKSSAVINSTMGALS